MESKLGSYNILNELGLFEWVWSVLWWRGGSERIGKGRGNDRLLVRREGRVGRRVEGLR